MNGRVLAVIRLPHQRWGMIIDTPAGPRAFPVKHHAPVEAEVNWCWVGMDMAVDIDKHGRVIAARRVTAQELALA